MLFRSFRERDYEMVSAMYEDAKKMAQGAALMTNTEIDTIMTVGSAWPRYFSKPVAEATYACSFATGQWNAEDWLSVRSPRWTFEGTWLQEADHIRNSVPLDASPAALQGERAGETYASMLHRHSVKSSLRVRAELSFDECMEIGRAHV